MAAARAVTAAKGEKSGVRGMNPDPVRLAPQRRVAEPSRVQPLCIYLFNLLSLTCSLSLVVCELVVFYLVVLNLVSLICCLELAVFNLLYFICCLQLVVFTLLYVTWCILSCCP